MSGVTAHPAQPMQRVLRLGYRKSIREGRKVGFAYLTSVSHSVFTLRYHILRFSLVFCRSTTSWARFKGEKSNSTKLTQQQHSTKRKRFLIQHNLIFPALVRIGFCYFQVVRQNTFSQTNPRRRRVQPPQTREYHLLPALKTIPPKKNSILNQTLKRRPLFLLSRKANHLK